MKKSLNYQDFLQNFCMKVTNLSATAVTVWGILHQYGIQYWTGQERSKTTDSVKYDMQR